MYVNDDEMIPAHHDYCMHHLPLLIIYVLLTVRSINNMDAYHPYYSTLSTVLSYTSKGSACIYTCPSNCYAYYIYRILDSISGI